MQFTRTKNSSPLRINARDKSDLPGETPRSNHQTMSCKLCRGPRWALSTLQRCAARRQVTIFCFMRQSRPLLRRAVVVLKNLLRGWHSSEVRDTTEMPPEGYEYFFARRGGSARCLFRCLNYCLLPASSQTCHSARAHPNPE